MSNDNNSLLINFGLFKGRFFALHRPLSISFEISFTAVFKGHAKQASQPFILESVNFNEDQNVSKTSRFKFLIHSCLNYNRFDPERQHKCFVEKNTTEGSNVPNGRHQQTHGKQELAMYQWQILLMFYNRNLQLNSRNVT